MVDTSSGLLRNTVAVLQHLGVFVVDEGSQITTVIKDQVQGLAILESLELLLEAPLILFLCLTLPCETIKRLDSMKYGTERRSLVHWSATSSNSSSGVVLGGENVAGRPSDFCAKVLQGFDEDGSLDGYIVLIEGWERAEWGQITHV